MRLTLLPALCASVLCGPTAAQTLDRFQGVELLRHSAQSGGEVLRLIRNDKLDLVLPGAMRDNGVDMWIHVTQQGDQDPMAMQFGETYGYLVFTDRGGKIERAVFGGAGAVEKIDVRGSAAIARALSSYDAGYRLAEGYGDEVYDEFRKFVAERNPKTIAVNSSTWLPVADGASHSAYQRLTKTLGPEYSARLVSADKVITDYIVRRTVREVAAQITTLEISRQIALEALARIRPGVTTIREITSWAMEEAFKRGVGEYRTWSPGGIRLYYSEKSRPTTVPNSRWWIVHGDYVFQRGDFFAFNMGVNYLGFGTDTKTHAYILRDGEASVPRSLQHAFDQAKRGQWIMRDSVRIGMTAAQVLDAVVAAMEREGYIHTPFRNSSVGAVRDDIPDEDYVTLQKALRTTNKSGFYVDLHSFGNTGVVGPSISNFRPDVHHLKIQDNHIFAFEYAVHTNLPERPEFPISINISNPQLVTPKGVEFIQPPNETITLIR
ncbi:M24 family metallopeptidase [Povalibacter sp.]|uniref:M24 family metallopeptidase n=1 Tax=Povalibacter sp. TaxID=1962978 RepID=UPI002F3F5812